MGNKTCLAQKSRLLVTQCKTKHTKNDEHAGTKRETSFAVDDIIFRLKEARTSGRSRDEVKRLATGYPSTRRSAHDSTFTNDISELSPETTEVDACFPTERSCKALSATPVCVFLHREPESVVQGALLAALENVQLVITAIGDAHVRQACCRGAAALHGFDAFRFGVCMPVFLEFVWFTRVRDVLSSYLVVSSSALMKNSDRMARNRKRLRKVASFLEVNIRRSMQQPDSAVTPQSRVARGPRSGHMLLFVLEKAHRRGSSTRTAVTMSRSS